MPTAILEREDIQALVRSGFGKLEGSRLLLVRVRPGREAQARERRREAVVLSVAEFDDARLAKRRINRVLQIAVSAPGLAALGLAQDVIERFPADFQAGIASDERRSFRLGDVGANSPTRWKW